MIKLKRGTALAVGYTAVGELERLERLERLEIIDQYKVWKVWTYKINGFDEWIIYFSQLDV